MEIKTYSDFKDCLSAGAYAWPGGYPKYFLFGDGEALSFSAADENIDLICEAFETNNTEWRVVGCDINWEDPDLRCIVSGELIECAYCK